jgi:predicted TIM-barrel fold metal-dependent hydrolase
MDYRMISADDHLDLGFLPKELWTDRLPKKFLERAPHVEERDGGDFWVCDDQVWGDWRGGSWWSRQRDKNIVYALDRAGVAEDNVLRPSTPELRMADMDRDGVAASVLFGPILPMSLDDHELKNACIEVYNDWLIEFCQSSPDRLIGAAMLSKDDPIAAADEVVRLAKDGRIKQVNHLCGDFHAGMYSDPEWDRFWSAAEEANMIVSIHTGGGTRTAPNALAARPAASRQGAFRGGDNSYAPALSGMLSFGVLERHPGIKFVLAEAQIGWLPYAVQQMDRSYRRGMESKGGVEGGPLRQMPSETFRRQVYATYEQDQCGLYLLDFFGEGKVMWASDYPHPASTWPDSQSIADRETAHLSESQKRAVLHDNAAQLYGIQV